jgi:spermidine synthase
VCPAGVFDTTSGTKYFQSNGVCQEVVRCHVAVRDKITEVNVPFRQAKIKKYQQQSRTIDALSENGISADDVLWEKAYHEAAVHVPLEQHASPEKVLILGGGLGGLLRETLKHPGTKDITVVEVDQKVVDLSSHLLPQINDAGEVFKHCSLVIDDAYEYIRNAEQFDIIINDIEEEHPKGKRPGDFLSAVASRLSENGIYIQPGSTDMVKDAAELKATLDELETQFEHAGVFFATLPMVGQYPFLWASQTALSIT